MPWANRPMADCSVGRSALRGNLDYPPGDPSLVTRWLGPWAVRSNAKTTLGCSGPARHGRGVGPVQIPV